jgi:hypothetical protein
MKSLLAFALLAGCAWGQGQPAPISVVPIFLIEQNPLKMILGGSWCDGYLEMGNSTRAVKDVFKEECAAANTTTLAPRDSDGSTSSGTVVKGNIPDDCTRYDHCRATAEKSVEYSEAGRVKLSGVQDHADKAQIVGGGVDIGNGLPVQSDLVDRSKTPIPGVDIVGGQAKKRWRIDWSVPEGVPTPKIGECYQVVDDGERGSELKQVRCRKPQSR